LTGGGGGVWQRKIGTLDNEGELERTIRSSVTSKSVTSRLNWSAQHHVYITYMVMTCCRPTGQLNVGRDSNTIVRAVRAAQHSYIIEV